MTGAALQKLFLVPVPVFLAKAIRANAAHGQQDMGVWVVALGVVNHHVGHHARSEEHTSELQSPDHLVCRLLLAKKNVALALIAGGIVNLWVERRGCNARRAPRIGALGEITVRDALKVGFALFFSLNADHRHPHSIPTRRSSD